MSISDLKFSSFVTCSIVLNYRTKIPSYYAMDLRSKIITRTFNYIIASVCIWMGAFFKVLELGEWYDLH